MAEVQTNSGGPRRGPGARQKKKSTRIDMTAMVDVAFLLLTFFILTTTMASPQAMKAILPPEPEHDPKPTVHSKILTLILGEDNQVHCFRGIPGESEIQTVDFSADGVRQVIAAHLDSRPDRCPDGASLEEIQAAGCWDPIIVIKPAGSSKYSNLVDILDEMAIGNVRKFILADVVGEDSLAMRAQGKR